MYSSGSLGVVDASNATSCSQGAFARGNDNAATAEPVIATHRIDQHNIPRCYVILQAEVETGDFEAASSGVPGRIGSRASDHGCTYRERLARRHNNAVLISADDGYTGAVVGRSDSEVHRHAVGCRARSRRYKGDI
jgi:hypothetical protein